MQQEQGHLPPSSDIQDLLREINELKAGLLVDSVTHDNPTFEGPPWAHERGMQGPDRLQLDIPGGLDDSLEEMVANDARLQYILSPQAEEQVRSSLRFDQDSISPQRAVATPFERPDTSGPSPSGLTTSSGTPATPADAGLFSRPGYDAYMTATSRVTPVTTPDTAFMTPASVAPAATPSQAGTANPATVHGRTMPTPATAPATGTVRKAIGSRIARPAGIGTPTAAGATPSGSAGAAPVRTAVTSTTVSPSTISPSAFGRSPSHVQSQPHTHHAAGGSAPGAHSHASPGGGGSSHVAARGLPASTPPQAPRTGARTAKLAAVATAVCAASSISRGAASSTSSSSRIPTSTSRAGSSNLPSPANSVGVLRSGSGSVSAAVASTPAAGSTRKRPSQTGQDAPSAAPARRPSASTPATAAAHGAATHHHPPHGVPAQQHSQQPHAVKRTSFGTTPGPGSKTPAKAGHTGHSAQGAVASRVASPASVAAASSHTPALATTPAKVAAAPVVPVTARSTVAAASSTPRDSHEMECEVSHPSLTLPSWGGADPLVAESLESLLEEDPVLRQSWMAATQREAQPDDHSSPSALPVGANGTLDSAVLQRRTSDELLRPLAVAMAQGEAQEDWMQEDADTEMNLLIGASVATTSSAVEPAESTSESARSARCGGVEPWAMDASSPAPPPAQSTSVGGPALQGGDETTPSTALRREASAAGSTAAGIHDSPPGSTVCKVRELLGLDDPNGPDMENDSMLLNSEELWRNVAIEANSMFATGKEACTEQEARQPPSQGVPGTSAFTAAANTVEGQPEALASPAAAAELGSALVESPMSAALSRAMSMQQGPPAHEVTLSGDSSDGEHAGRPPKGQGVEADIAGAAAEGLEDSVDAMDTDVDGAALELLAAEAAAAAVAIVAGSGSAAGGEEHRGMAAAPELEVGAASESVEAGPEPAGGQRLLHQTSNASSVGFDAAVEFEAAMISRQLAGGASSMGLQVSTSGAEAVIREEEEEDGAEVIESPGSEAGLPMELAGEALIVASQLQFGGGPSSGVDALTDAGAIECDAAELAASDHDDASSSSGDELAAAAAAAAVAVMTPPTPHAAAMIVSSPAEAEMVQAEPATPSAPAATCATTGLDGGAAAPGLAAPGTESEVLTEAVRESRPSPDVHVLEEADQGTLTTQSSAPVTTAAAVSGAPAVAVLAATKQMPKDSAPIDCSPDMEIDGSSAEDQRDPAIVQADGCRTPLAAGMGPADPAASVEAAGTPTHVGPAELPAVSDVLEASSDLGMQLAEDEAVTASSPVPAAGLAVGSATAGLIAAADSSDSPMAVDGDGDLSAVDSSKAEAALPLGDLSTDATDDAEVKEADAAVEAAGRGIDATPILSELAIPASGAAAAIVSDDEISGEAGNEAVPSLALGGVEDGSVPLQESELVSPSEVLPLEMIAQETVRSAVSVGNKAVPAEAMAVDADSGQDLEQAVAVLPVAAEDAGDAAAGSMHVDALEGAEEEVPAAGTEQTNVENEEAGLTDIAAAGVLADAPTAMEMDAFLTVAAASSAVAEVAGDPAAAPGDMQEETLQGGIEEEAEAAEPTSADRDGSASVESEEGSDVAAAIVRPDAIAVMEEVAPEPETMDALSGEPLAAEMPAPLCRASSAFLGAVTAAAVAAELELSEPAASTATKQPLSVMIDEEALKEVGSMDSDANAAGAGQTLEAAVEEFQVVVTPGADGPQPAVPLPILSDAADTAIATAATVSDEAEGVAVGLTVGDGVATVVDQPLVSVKSFEVVITPSPTESVAETAVAVALSIAGSSDGCPEEPQPSAAGDAAAAEPGAVDTDESDTVGGIVPVGGAAPPVPKEISSHQLTPMKRSSDGEGDELMYDAEEDGFEVRLLSESQAACSLPAAAAFAAVPPVSVPSAPAASDAAPWPEGSQCPPGMVPSLHVLHSPASAAGQNLPIGDGPTAFAVPTSDDLASSSSFPEAVVLDTANGGGNEAEDYDEDDDGVPAELPRKVPIGAGPAVIAAAAAAAAAAEAYPGVMARSVKHARFQSPRGDAQSSALPAADSAPSADSGAAEDGMDFRLTHAEREGVDGAAPIDESASVGHGGLLVRKGPVAEGLESGGGSEDVVGEAVAQPGDQATEAKAEETAADHVENSNDGFSGVKGSPLAAAALEVAAAVSSPETGLGGEDRLASDASQASSAFASVQAMAAVTRDSGGDPLGREQESFINAGTSRISPESFPSDTFSLVFSEMGSRMVSSTGPSWATAPTSWAAPSMTRQSCMPGQFVGRGPSQDAGSFSSSATSTTTGRSAAAVEAAAVIMAAAHAAASEPAPRSREPSGSGSAPTEAAVQVFELAAAEGAPASAAPELRPQSPEAAPDAHGLEPSASTGAGSDESQQHADQSSTPLCPPLNTASRGDAESSEPPLLHAWQVLASPVTAGTAAGQDSEAVEGSPSSAPKGRMLSSRTSMRSLLGGNSRLSRVSSCRDEDEAEEQREVAQHTAEAVGVGAVAAIAEGPSSSSETSDDMDVDKGGEDVEAGEAVAAVAADSAGAAATNVDADVAGGNVIERATPGAPSEDEDMADGDGTPSDAVMAESEQAEQSLVADTVSAAAAVPLAAGGAAAPHADHSGEDEQLVPAWKLVQACRSNGGPAASPMGAAATANTCSSPSLSASSSLGCRRSLRSIQLAPTVSRLKRSVSQASLESSGLVSTEPQMATPEVSAAACPPSSSSAHGSDAVAPAGATSIPGAPIPTAVVAATGANHPHGSDIDGEDGLKPAWKIVSASGGVTESPEAVSAARGAPLGSQRSFRSARSGHSRLRRSTAPEGEDMDFLRPTGADGSHTFDAGVGAAVVGGVEEVAPDVEGAVEDIAPLRRARSRTLPGNPASLDTLQMEGAASGYSSDGTRHTSLLRNSSAGRTGEALDGDSRIGLGLTRSSTLDSSSAARQGQGTVSESGSMAVLLASRYSSRRAIPDSIGTMPLPRRSFGGGDPNVDALRPAWQVLPLAMGSPTSSSNTPTGSAAAPPASLTGGGSNAGTPSAANMLASMRSSSRLSRMSSGIPEDLLAELKVQAHAAVGHLQGSPHGDDSGGGLADMLSSVEESEARARVPTAAMAGAAASEVAGADGAGGTVHAWKVLPLRAPSTSAPGVGSDVNHGVPSPPRLSAMGGRPALGATRAQNQSSRLAVASSKGPALQVSFQRPGSSSSRPLSQDDRLSEEDDEAVEEEDEEDRQPAEVAATAAGAEAGHPPPPPTDGDEALVPAWKLVAPSTLPVAEGAAAAATPDPGGSQPGLHVLGSRRSLKSLGSLGGSRLSRTSIAVEDYVDESYSAPVEPIDSDSRDGAAMVATAANQEAVAAAAGLAAAAADADAAGGTSMHSTGSSCGAGGLDAASATAGTSTAAPADQSDVRAGGDDGVAQQGTSESACEHPTAGEDAAPAPPGLHVQLPDASGPQEESARTVPDGASRPTADGIPPASPADITPTAASTPAADAAGSKLSTPGSARRSVRSNSAGSSRLSRVTSQASESGLEDIEEEGASTAEAAVGAEGEENGPGGDHGLPVVWERASSGRVPPPAPSAGKARIGSPVTTFLGSPPGVAAPVATEAAGPSDQDEDAALVPAWKVLAPAGVASQAAADSRGDVDVGERLLPSAPGATRQPALRSQRSSNLSVGNSRLSRMTSGLSAEDDAPQPQEAAAPDLAAEPTCAAADGAPAKADEVHAESNDDRQGAATQVMDTLPPAASGPEVCLQTTSNPPTAPSQPLDITATTHELSNLTLANMPVSGCASTSAPAVAVVGQVSGSQFSSFTTPQAPPSSGGAAGVAAPTLLAPAGVINEEDTLQSPGTPKPRQQAEAQTGGAAEPQVAQEPEAAAAPSDSAAATPTRPSGDVLPAPKLPTRRSRGLFACFACFGGGPADAE